MRLTRSRLIFALTATVSLAVPVGFTAAGSAAAAAAAVTGGSPQFANAVAFDVSQPFSVLAGAETRHRYVVRAIRVFLVARAGP